MSLWFLVRWEAKAVPNSSFACGQLGRRSGLIEETTSVHKFRGTICKTGVQPKKIAISGKLSNILLGLPWTANQAAAGAEGATQML